jgi:hypothetical protein
VSGVSKMVQLDLEGNEVTTQAVAGLPGKGKLAMMAATGTDIRLLIIILIAMEVPTSALLNAVGC